MTSDGSDGEISKVYHNLIWGFSSLCLSSQVFIVVKYLFVGVLGGTEN